MAILRYQELMELSTDELDDHLFELRNELMKIKGVLASGGIPEDVGRMRVIKRTIARILTYKTYLGKNPQLKEEKEKLVEARKKEGVLKEKTKKPVTQVEKKVESKEELLTKQTKKEKEEPKEKRKKEKEEPKETELQQEKKEETEKTEKTEKKEKKEEEKVEEDINNKKN